MFNGFLPISWITKINTNKKNRIVFDNKFSLALSISICTGHIDRWLLYVHVKNNTNFNRTISCFSIALVRCAVLTLLLGVGSSKWLSKHWWIFNLIGNAHVWRIVLPMPHECEHLIDTFPYFLAFDLFDMSPVARNMFWRCYLYRLLPSRLMVTQNAHFKGESKRI